MHFSLRPPHGFHPTASVELSPSDLEHESKSNDCALNLFYRLPPELFVDPYELANHRSSYTFLHWGTRNLELPVAAVSPEGSAVLLTVNEDVYANGTGGDGDGWKVDVPLHARYGVPQSEPYHKVTIPAPEAFWSCPGDGTSVVVHGLPDMPGTLSKPFTGCVIQRLSPAEPVSLDIPVGNPADLAFVEMGTACTIFVAFSYLVFVAYKTAKRLRTQHVVQKQD